MKLTVNLIKKGDESIVKNNILNVKNALFNAMNRILVLHEDASIAYYENRRITDKTPSLIIESFAYQAQMGNKINGIVWCGSESDTTGAYYAKWVDKGHTLRNGTWWPGYEFMKVGADVVRDSIPSIIREEVENSLSNTSKGLNIFKSSFKQDNSLMQGDSFSGPN